MNALPCSTDYEFEIDLTRKATTTGDSEAAAGISGLSAWISATKGGAALHANLSKSLAERSGEPGRYWCIFETGDLKTHLIDGSPSYRGRTVWIVVNRSGDITSHSFSRQVVEFAAD